VSRTEVKKQENKEWRKGKRRRKKENERGIIVAVTSLEEVEWYSPWKIPPFFFL
jgi:hypothetical protein